MPKLARLDSKAFDRAVAAYRAGSYDVARSLLERFAQQEPAHAGARFVLGLLAWSRGDETSAEMWFGKACELQPGNGGFHSNWAEAARRLGRFDVAIERFGRALALDDSSPESHYNLGLALSGEGRWQRARDSFRHATQLAPGDPRLARRLAQAHHELGELDETVNVLEALLLRAPDDARALAALGVALFHRAEHAAAGAALRRSLSLAPSAETHGALLFQSMFDPAHDAASVLAEARAFGHRYGSHELRLPAAARERNRDSERPLRVGYVSSELREHVTGNVVLPLLRHHSPQTEVFLYAAQTRSDWVTEQFRRHARVWRDIHDLTDDQAATLIVEDGIDILVDLGMHLAGSRPGIFARKPAPIQMCWFAYPGTTGLATIDYRVSDPFLDPPGSDESYTEQTLRLPDAFWCWEPLLQDLDPGPLPLLERGHVTFGCLNNFCKLTDDTLVAWSHVMGTVERSQLLLLAPSGTARERVLTRLGSLGVTRERVRFAPYQGRRAYFELYREVDVALDTLPYNGHTTSLDAMWMGVPVLSLLGERVVGRAGGCQARALGLPELIAQTTDELGERAGDLVNDTARLAALRGSLRQRLQASTLMDGARFAVAFEALYRGAWRDWCRKLPHR